MGLMRGILYVAVGLILAALLYFKGASDASSTDTAVIAWNTFLQAAGPAVTALTGAKAARAEGLLNGFITILAPLLIVAGVFEASASYGGRGP
jgi:hypothetical protein